jgi:hypothetical protein
MVHSFRKKPLAGGLSPENHSGFQKVCKPEPRARGQTVYQFFFRQNTDSADGSQDSGKIIYEIFPLFLCSRPGRALAKALGHWIK